LPRAAPRRDAGDETPYLGLMSRYDLTTRAGRFRAHWDYVWGDHAFLRRWFRNAHWLGPDLVRTNQPSPRQLADWKRQGIKTVINLRGARDEAYHALEKDACARLGLTLIDAPLDSRDPPQPDRIHRARELFRTIEYPALIHCKSGADRAGMMAVLYRHFHLGEPISEAIKQLDKKYLHHREGLTGVLDFTLEKYLNEVEPTGVTFLEWIDSPAYDPKAIRAEFKAQWWGTLLTEKLLRRE
jgi:protein tyrosine/serine phosphatase